MTTNWLTVLLVGAVTIALKGAGPLLLGGRAHPRRLFPVLRLLAPALFAALIATQVFTHGRNLVLDARAAGLIAAIVGAALGARPLLVLVAACAATAISRLVLP